MENLFPLGTPYFEISDDGKIERKYIFEIPFSLLPSKEGASQTRFINFSDAFSASTEMLIQSLLDTKEISLSLWVKLKEEYALRKELGALKYRKRYLPGDAHLDVPDHSRPGYRRWVAITPQTQNFFTGKRKDPNESHCIVLVMVKTVKFMRGKISYTVSDETGEVPLSFQVDQRNAFSTDRAAIACIKNCLHQQFPRCAIPDDSIPSFILLPGGCHRLPASL
ncbi:hypothetical protein COB52_01665 [Candidatus Kaiserbacteria bacterium]|nr:MAG: hypothetical protein COB52_01665 [Candidatus Kaiserbacteria bacterium]